MKLWVHKLGVLAVLAAGLMCSQVTVASAAVSRRDAAATRTFLTAGGHYFTHAVAAKSHIRASAKAFVDRVAASCPNVLAGASASGGSITQSDNIGAVELEAADDFYLTAIHTVRTPLSAALRSLAHLHWSRARVTRGMAAFVRAARKILALKGTDLCADIRTAAGTSFNQLPAATTRFLQAFSVQQSAPGWPQLFKLVAPFETGSLRAQGAKVEKLDRRSAASANSVLKPQFARLRTILLGPGQ